MSTLYEYPNGVLKNRFGIQDRVALAQAEAAATGLRIAQLLHAPLPGNFDLVHLQALHLFIFQDVYEWAGEIRTIDIGKGPGQFAHHAFIVANAAKLFAQLAREQNLQSLGMASFAARAAYYFGEVNALHPFLEGNGRAQRLFFLLLSQQSGFRLEWGRISAQEMVDASSLSLLRGDNSALEQLFLRILVPTSP